MSRRGTKPKAASVAVTVDDLRAMKRSTLGLTPNAVKKAAKTRACGRELFLECGSADIALFAMVSGLKKPLVDNFCRNFLKQ
jgi:hypothetical protein